jgi:hypothetical protein
MPVPFNSWAGAVEIVLTLELCCFASRCIVYALAGARVRQLAAAFKSASDTFSSGSLLKAQACLRISKAYIEKLCSISRCEI